MNFILLYAILFENSLCISNVSMKANQSEVAIKRQIISNRVKARFPIEEHEASKLARKITKISIKYQINPRLYTAILMQESKYKLDAKGCHSKQVANENGDLQKTKKCVDFGMSQVNIKTARAMGLSIDRLLTELEYSLEAGAAILSDFKRRFSKKEINWWTRYNASNPEKRAIYQELVQKYL